MKLGRLSSLTVLLFAAAACRAVGSGPNAGPQLGPRVVGEGTLALLDPPDSGKSPDERNYRFIIPVEIHGRTFQFAVDHGSSIAAISDSTAVAAHIPRWLARAMRVDTLVRHDGIAPVRDTTANIVLTTGDSIFEYWGDFEPRVVDSIRVAGSLQSQLAMWGEWPATRMPGFDGILGRDVLSQFDLEFNVRRGVLLLYARSTGPPGSLMSSLPPGITASDCVAAEIIPHMGMDTTGMDSTDGTVEPLAFKRLWDSEELLLPLVVEGHAIAAHFDSGSGETTMNWAAARLLGFDRASSGVIAAGSGSHEPLQTREALHARELDTTNYRTRAIAVRIGNRALPVDSLLISDAALSQFDGFETKPLILVGLRHFRNNVLFLSYSTNMVCVGAPIPR